MPKRSSFGRRMKTIKRNWSKPTNGSVMTIMEYAEAFNKGPIPNETAKKLLDEVLVIEEAEAKTKRAYADKVAKVLPAAKTARYIQIETKIRALLRAELAKRIPFAY